MKRFFTLLIFVSIKCIAQSPWPTESWSAASNLTAQLDFAGVTELSGLHWNPETNRLYVVHGDGRLHVLQYSEPAGTFTEIADKFIPGGPEGITQVNYADNQFYVIDENNYQIRKYVHNASFGNITLSRSWDLTSGDSPMENTGNIGPEGIVFVPDENLIAAGQFISSEFNVPYTSIKGMGGLMFVAHQDGGYIWVFDLNPNVDDDFVFVGKYKTSRAESCDLALDRSISNLYILHNIDENYLEVTNMSTPLVAGERKFQTIDEYILPTIADNVNVEGMAIRPLCPDDDTGLWLCRDIEMTENENLRFDALRYFDEFLPSGNCALAVDDFAADFTYYPNPASDFFSIEFEIMGAAVNVSILTLAGAEVFKVDYSNVGRVEVPICSFSEGIYFVRVSTSSGSKIFKLIKQ